MHPLQLSSFIKIFMYKPTIGLEIHVELSTRTKMFCSCLNDPDEKRPNFNICPVCTAQPGTLPVANEEAIKKVLPAVEVNEESLKKLYNGSPIFREFLLEDLRIKEGEKFAVFCGDVFVGVYVSGKEKNILAKPVFVYNRV